MKNPKRKKKGRIKTQEVGKVNYDDLPVGFATKLNRLDIAYARELVCPDCRKPMEEVERNDTVSKVGAICFKCKLAYRYNDETVIRYGVAA